MSLRKAAISGLGWAFANQFGTQVISFVVSIIMARLLLPAEFGLIGMISVLIGVGTSLINSGLTHSLIRTPHPDQQDYSTVFYFNLAGSVVIYWLFFFTAPLIADFFSAPILTDIVRVYCLTFVINAFSEVQLTRLTKAMNFKLQMEIAIPSLVGGGSLGIYLAYHGFGVWSLVWMSLFQAFLNTTQLWVRGKWSPSLVFNRDKFSYHFHFGYKLTLSGLINTLFNNIYQVIIGKFFRPAQVGFYTRADSLKQLPVTNISLVLSKVTYPLFASIHDDDIRLKRAYKNIMQMVIFIIAPVLIIMAVLAEPLFRFLFTDKWLPAVPYFQILCIAGLLYPIHDYNLNILNVKGRSDLFLRLEIVKKCVTVIIILITLRYGIIALICGQALSSIFAFFINTHYTGKFLQYNSLAQAKDIAPAIILALLSGAVVWALDNAMFRYFENDFPRLIAGCLAGTLTYLAIAALLKMDSLQEAKYILFKKKLPKDS